MILLLAWGRKRIQSVKIILKGDEYYDLLRVCSLLWTKQFLWMTNWEKCNRRCLRSVLRNCNTVRGTEEKGACSLDKDIRSPESEFNFQKFLKVSPPLTANLLAAIPLYLNDFSNLASKIISTPKKRKIHGKYTTSVTFFVLRGHCWGRTWRKMKVPTKHRHTFCIFISISIPRRDARSIKIATRPAVRTAFQCFNTGIVASNLTRGHGCTSTSSLCVVLCKQTSSDEPIPRPSS